MLSPPDIRAGDPTGRASTRRVFLFILGLCLAACDSGPLSTQLGLLPVERHVDLSKALPGEWTRVCILGPYSTNGHARDVLGADVNIQTRSSVYHSDSYSLLVTMRGNREDALYDVYRTPSDFSRLDGECFKRDDALFLVEDEGHPFATHVPWQQRPPDL